MWFIFDGCGITCLCFAYGILFGSNIVVMTIGDWPGGQIGTIIGRVVYEILFILAIWSHLACMLTDPGAVPKDTEAQEGMKMCKKCNAPKPERAHHCSTCKRCILKMDHHCPWVNNCVGARNQKYFLLFLFYVQLQCWAALWSLGIHFSNTPMPQRPRRHRGRGFLAKDSDAAADEARWQAERDAVRRSMTGNEISDASIISCAMICFVAMIFGLFTCIMLCDQVSNITSDSTGIENLKASGNEKKGKPWRDSLQEVMGRGPSLSWLLPLPHRRQQVKDLS